MNAMDSSTVVTLGGILLVMQIAGIAVSIWARLRRRPPIDQTLQDYVRRDEFERLRADLDKRCDELAKTDGKLFDLIRDTTARDASWKNGISTQMGRLESAVAELLKRTSP